MEASTPGVNRTGWVGGIPWVIGAGCVFLYPGSFQTLVKYLGGLLLLSSILLYAWPWFRESCRGWLRARREEIAAYPSGSRSIPWLAVFVFVVAPAMVVYRSAARLPLGGDTWPVIPTAASLVQRGDWNVNEFVTLAPDLPSLEEGLPYCLIRRDGHVYSLYPLGMVPTAVPLVALWKATGMDFSTNRRFQFAQRQVAVIHAGLIVGFFFLLALHLGSVGAASWATGLLALASVVFSTVSEALWQHDGIILWSLILLLAEFHRGAEWSWKALLIQGVGAAMMIACRLSAVVFLLPFGLWMLCRQPRRGLTFGLVALLCYVPWAIVQFSIYGNPFGPASRQLHKSGWTMNLVEGLTGLLVSPARGLLVYQPWLLLGLLLLIPVFRGRNRDTTTPASGWVWVCLAAFLAQLLLVGCWKDWHGGHCWGSRLMAESVPLLALLCVAPLTVLVRSRPGRFAVGLMAAIAFVPHAVGMYHNPQWEPAVQLDRNPRVVWSWARAPFLYPWVRH